MPASARVLSLILVVLLVWPAVGCRAQMPDQTTGDASPEGPRDTLDQPVSASVDGDTIAWPAARVTARVVDDSLWAEALRIHFNAIVLDGHVDVPMHMVDDAYRLDRRHSRNRSHVDLPRMREGGLDAAVFAVYVAPYYGEGDRAVARAREQIQEVRRQVGAAPGVDLAQSADDVRRITREGREAIVLGLEGGHALAASTDTLQSFARQGIRYVTLTHVNTNRWADSSQDEPEHGGLSPLGRKMVWAMNDLGVVVDLAHVSDSTFFDAIEASRAPVIVSHSSSRALTPTVRNVSDKQMRAVALNGGVVMINFFDAMVNPHLGADVFEEARRRLTASGRGLAYLWSAVYDIRRERSISGATWGDVVDHIDHAVQVAGIDHVGIGSDFDGVFDLPRGLDDVTDLPYVTYGLLRRGYSEAEVYKLLGGNLLRVLKETEAMAQEAP